MFGDVGKMMKQVNEMKASMKAAQKELQDLILDGHNRDKKIRIKINGEMEIKEIKIDEDLLKVQTEEFEREMLAAVRDSISKAKKAAADKLGKITGGLNLPGM
ncbi:MAG: YbaB/EbfC family nucleoid-associated protein [Candidatus Margulisiibacteriota bacterium]|jgi:hypothetical protein